MSNQRSTWRPELGAYLPADGCYGLDTRPAGVKIAKAAGKHRADHSNPGGIISEFFRQKRYRL